MTSRQLDGAYLLRLFPQVYALRDHVMTDLDWIVAAELSMPERAQVSHLSRIHKLGVDLGALRPFHFTITGDLHIDTEDISLHRTVALPPLDDIGVTPAAAFIQLCADARMIDAIKIGDWLLRDKHMTLIEVGELARRDDWRPGAHQVRRVLPHLDERARSPKESETRAVLTFAGLPKPDVNKNVYRLDGTFLGCGDLVYLIWKLLIEYEGSQHLADREQWNVDIDRYGGFRNDDWCYIQVTKEKLDKPKKLVSEVYGQLVQCGYDGPQPTFGDRWKSLFGSCRLLIPPGGD